MTYDQWKDPTHWDSPSLDCGAPTDDQLLDRAIAEARTTPDETHDALLGLIGLVRMIAAIPDLPVDIKNTILRDGRYVDARAVAIAYL